MVSRVEFEDWTRSAVTREMFKYVRDQVDSAKEALATDAGINPLADRDLVGGIAALREVLEWQPDYGDETE